MTPSIIENILSCELLRNRLRRRPFATFTHAVNCVNLGDEPRYSFPIGTPYGYKHSGNCGWAESCVNWTRSGDLHGIGK